MYFIIVLLFQRQYAVFIANKDVFQNNSFFIEKKEKSKSKIKAAKDKLHGPKKSSENQRVNTRITTNALQNKGSA